MSFTENPRSALCSAGVCCGTCGVEAELEAYAPLVRSVAWRYAGRGAEFEDLVQEGCLALLVLIPRCPDRRWLARYLKTNLPGYVRDAAARMRKPITNGGETMTEELEATLGRDEERYEETELRETLERLLTRKELDITQASAHARGARHNAGARRGLHAGGDSEGIRRNAAGRGRARQENPREAAKLILRRKRRNAAKVTRRRDKRKNQTLAKICNLCKISLNMRETRGFFQERVH